MPETEAEVLQRLYAVAGTGAGQFDCYVRFGRDKAVYAAPVCESGRTQWHIFGTDGGGAHASVEAAAREVCAKMPPGTCTGEMLSVCLGPDAVLHSAPAQTAADVCALLDRAERSAVVPCPAPAFLACE